MMWSPLEMRQQQPRADQKINVLQEDVFRKIHRRKRATEVTRFKEGPVAFWFHGFTNPKYEALPGHIEVTMECKQHHYK